MAKFSSEEIGLLQKSASRTPQVQQPSGNLVADIANLASTGLGIYKQQQDKKALATAKEQQSTDDKKLASAVNGFNRLKLELVANKDIPVLARQKKMNEYLDQFGDPEFRQQVSSISRKDSGLGRVGVIEKGQLAQKEAVTEARIVQDRERAESERKAAEAQAEEDRRLTLVTAARTAGLPVDNIGDLTEAEQFDVLKAATIVEADAAKNKMEYAEILQKAQVDDVAQEKRNDKFIMATLPAFQNELSSEIGGVLNKIDTKDPNNLELAYDVLDRMRGGQAQKIEEMVQNAQKVGASLGIEEINAFKTAQEDILSDWETILGNEELSATLSRYPKMKGIQEIVKSLSSPKATERTAAMTILTKMAIGEEFSLTDNAHAVSIIAEAFTGEGSYNFSGDPDEFKLEVVTLGESLNTGGRDISPEDKENNFKTAMKLLDTGKGVEQRIVEQGGLSEVVKSIAESEGKNFSEEQGKEVGEFIYDKSSRYAAAAIAAAINERTSRVVNLTARGETVARYAGINDFTLDEDTLELVPINLNGYRIVPSESIMEYNNYVKDVLDSLDYLGIEDTKKYKEDIAKSVLTQMSN